MTDADCDLVVLRICSGPLEATVLRSLLEAYGIFCYYQAETHRGLFGPVPALEARLLVPAHQAQEADQLLRADVLHHGTGGYRDPYPLPATAPEPGGPLWRPYLTWLMVAFVLVLVGVATLGMKISGRPLSGLASSGVGTVC